jgi:hypothetical protein
MHYAFGTWLARYKGQNSRVHQLKSAFKFRAKEQKTSPSMFRNVDSVYAVLVTGDCLPDWGEDLLRLCERCWKAGRDDFGAREQISLLTKDMPWA